MRMAIPTITPIIRTTHTMGRTRMRQRTRIGTTVATEIRVATRNGKIRRIQIQRILIQRILSRRIQGRIDRQA